MNSKNLNPYWYGWCGSNLPNEYIELIFIYNYSYFPLVKHAFSSIFIFYIIAFPDFEKNKCFKWGGKIESSLHHLSNIAYE